MRDTSSIRILVWLSVALLLLIVIVPVYVVVVTSFKQASQILTGESLYLPAPATLSNYFDILSGGNFPHWLMNSAIVALVTTLFSLVVGGLAAYALVRLRMPGRRFLGTVVLVTYLVPPGLMFLPLYQSFIDVGLAGSLLSLMVAYPTFLVPFVTWLLMGFFQSIPVELEEAAMIDGATRPQVMFWVVLPLATPGLLAAGLFCFTLSWNEFLYALIFINDDRTKTVPVGLSEFLVGDFAFWGQLMAAACLASLPVLLIYGYLHKYMVGGLMSGAVKG